MCSKEDFLYDGEIDWESILNDSFSDDDKFEEKNELNDNVWVTDNSSPDESEKSSTKTPEVSRAKKSEKRYVCSFCAKVLKSAPEMKNHIKNHDSSIVFKASDYLKSVADKENTEEIQKVPPKRQRRKIKGPPKIESKLTQKIYEENFPGYLTKAIESLLKDRFLNLSETGQKVQRALKDHQGFESPSLQNFIWDCLKAGEGEHYPSVSCEKMWNIFHMGRTNPQFLSEGMENIKRFFHIQDSYISKMLFSSLCRALLDTVIIERNKLNTTETIVGPEKISPEQEKVLTYVGGYLVRSLRKKCKTRFKKSPKLNCYLSILDNLVSKDCQNSNTVAPKNTEWVAMVDRGGLVQICTDFFQLLCYIEEMVREKMSVNSLKNYYGGDIREDIFDEVITKPIVFTYWDRLCSSVQNQAAKNDMLSMLVKLYVTVRGHSFRKTLVELYQVQENCTSKGDKGLRKSLKINSNKNTVGD